VPMTSRLHFHGIFSSVESGVWPNTSGVGSGLAIQQIA
jgi:hypothetical protein